MDGQPLLGSAPRYRTLADEIAKDIASGRHALGALLPSEPELAAQYGVSRHTVREAVRLLQIHGMVSKRQGLGTRVEAAQVAQRYVLAMDAIPDLWEGVKESALKVTATRKIAARNAATPLPDSPPAHPWFLVEGVRHAGTGEALAWKQVYIDSDFGDVVPHLSKQHIPIYVQIEERYGIRTMSVRQQFSALTLPEAASTALRLPAGSAGLSILRHYLDANGRVFAVTRSVYPPDRYHHRVDLSLEYGRRP